MLRRVFPLRSAFIGDSAELGEETRAARWCLIDAAPAVMRLHEIAHDGEPDAAARIRGAVAPPAARTHCGLDGG